jgi:hypothetical protein
LFLLVGCGTVIKPVVETPQLKLTISTKVKQIMQKELGWTPGSYQKELIELYNVQIPVIPTVTQ